MVRIHPMGCTYAYIHLENVLEVMIKLQTTIPVESEVMFSSYV